jgi:mono/diheme cytochrome c family protein
MNCGLRVIACVCARAGWVLGLLAVSAQASVAQHATYTQEQVTQGRQVYSAHCSRCHGADLKGQAGPALAGPAFKSSIEYSKMSAKQLFDFMSTQMPYDDPGSLHKNQYLDVLAYLLSKNNYPASHSKLTEKALGQVELLPYPVGNAKQASKGN